MSSLQSVGAGDSVQFVWPSGDAYAVKVVKAAGDVIGRERFRTQQPTTTGRRFAARLSTAIGDRASAAKSRRRREFRAEARSRTGLPPFHLL